MRPVCYYKCFMHFFLKILQMTHDFKITFTVFFYHFKFISRNESNVNKMILPIYFEPYSQKKRYYVYGIISYISK